MRNKKAQVWVETVIYTLIAFAMIGLVLTYVRPKIEEFQDKSIIEESLDIMYDIDGIVREIVEGGAGNQREISLEINKGMFEINGISNKIVFEIESKYQFSEPGTTYSELGININTEEKGGLYIVILSKEYDYNITYHEEKTLRQVTSSATPYKILVSNKGNSGGETTIDFKFN